ncbi:hypothetical protein ACES2L_09645 [Bdellovibrio bacteriovorus]
MEVFKFNIIPTEEFLKRENFRMSVQNCELCGGPMEFDYQQSKEDAVIQENGKCQVCAHERKSSLHRVN